MYFKAITFIAKKIVPKPMAEIYKYVFFLYIKNKHYQVKNLKSQHPKKLLKTSKVFHLTTDTFKNSMRGGYNLACTSITMCMCISDHKR